MSFNWHAFWVFLALVIVASYALWRSYRVTLYRRDILNLRDAVAEWAAKAGKTDDIDYISLDRMLYFAADKADRLVLSDFLFFEVMAKLGLVEPRQHLNANMAVCFRDSANPSVRMGANLFLGRTIRYLTLESVSGIICGVGIYLYFLSGPSLVRAFDPQSGVMAAPGVPSRGLIPTAVIKVAEVVMRDRPVGPTGAAA